MGRISFLQAAWAHHVQKWSSTIPSHRYWVETQKCVHALARKRGRQRLGSRQGMLSKGSCSLWRGAPRLHGSGNVGQACLDHARRLLRSCTGWIQASDDGFPADASTKAARVENPMGGQAI